MLLVKIDTDSLIYKNKKPFLFTEKIV